MVKSVKIAKTLQGQLNFNRIIEGSIPIVWDASLSKFCLTLLLTLLRPSRFLSNPLKLIINSLFNWVVARVDTSRTPNAMFRPDSSRSCSRWQGVGVEQLFYHVNTGG
jgi:hypothetical protein